MKDILEFLFSGGELSKLEAKDVFLKLVSGTGNNSQAAALLSVYRMRLITLDELAGFRLGALELCAPLDFSEYKAIDVCGTGGDGKSTFNISTLAGLVAASCGEKITKHGSYAVSSRCGSSNVLEHLGYKFSNDQNKLKKELDEVGICFLHAPLFHPSFSKIAPVRKELAVKTIFNMLGPLVNPARPKAQLVGVYNQELFRIYKYLSEKEKLSFTIIHSLDGCDEISLTSNCICVWPNEEKEYAARDLGFERLSYQDIAEGNTIEESAEIFTKVVEGQGTKAQTNVVAANAGFAIRTSRLLNGKKAELLDCILEAKAAIESKEVCERFKILLEIQ